MKRPSIGCIVVGVLTASALVGCSKPNAGAIATRKQNQELRAKIAELEKREQGHLAQIAALESRSGTTVPSLPTERLGTLFTTHGLKFGRLTAGADFDPKQPGDDGLKIYVAPTDARGEPIKAAGAFAVDVFDLAIGENARVGHWDFPLDQADKNWFGKLTQYGYILPVPWQGQRPQHDELTVRVTFTDALTGRQFTEQKVVKVNLAR